MLNITSVIKQLEKEKYNSTINHELTFKDISSTSFVKNKDAITLFQIPTEKRNKNNTKIIKSVLKNLKAFNYRKYDIDHLTRKQDQNFLQVLCYFIGSSIAKKGQLISLTGRNRETVKILLSGNVYIFEPINYISLKQSFKEREVNSFDSIKNIFEQDSQFMYSSSSPKLSQNQTLQLLIRNRIFSKFGNPHKFIQQVFEGQLICESNWHKKLQQQCLNTFQATFLLPQAQSMIAVCSSDCLLLQIPLQILKRLIQILPNHSGINPHHRAYILSLLKSLNHIKQINFASIIQYVGRQWIIQRPYRYQIPSSQYFYHIVEGQVFIQQIIQKKNKNEEHSNKKIDQQAWRQKRSILTLYNGDFFGFEKQLFPEKKFVYLIEPQSKILKINFVTYAIQSEKNPALRKFVQDLRSQRKQILAKTVSPPQYYFVKQIQKQKAKQKKQYGFEKIIKPNQKQKLQQEKAYQSFRKLVLHEKKSDIKAKSTVKKQLNINPEQIQQSIAFISRQMLRGSTNILINNRQVRVLNNKGKLRRKIFIPQGQSERKTYRRIGLLDIKQVQISNKMAVNHRISMVGNSVKKGNIKHAFIGDRDLPNFPQLSKKQKSVTKLRSMSLPYIEHFSKKEDLIYKTKTKL